MPCCNAHTAQQDVGPLQYAITPTQVLCSFEHPQASVLAAPRAHPIPPILDLAWKRIGPAENNEVLEHQFYRVVGFLFVPCTGVPTANPPSQTGSCCPSSPRHDAEGILPIGCCQRLCKLLLLADALRPRDRAAQLPGPQAPALKRLVCGASRGPKDVPLVFALPAHGARSGGGLDVAARPHTACRDQSTLGEGSLAIALTGKRSVTGIVEGSMPASSAQDKLCARAAAQTCAPTLKRFSSCQNRNAAASGRCSS